VQDSPVLQPSQASPAAAFSTVPVSAFTPQPSTTAAQFTRAPTTAPILYPSQVPMTSHAVPTTQFTQSPAFPSAVQPGPGLTHIRMCRLQPLWWSRHDRLLQETFKGEPHSCTCRASAIQGGGWDHMLSDKSDLC